MSLLIFNRGQALSSNDLFINIRAANSSLIDPFSITYAVFDNSSGTPILKSGPTETPVKITVGKYYAPYVIPLDAELGDWLLIWTIQETSLTTPYTAQQPFVVAPADFLVGPYSSLLINPLIPNNEGIIRLIYRLRVLLRDNNPDRNYHFLPPTPEREIQGYTKKFRFIWEDYELYEYLLAGMNRINLAPPLTGFTLEGLPLQWTTLLLDAARIYAIQAITANWIADEFEYSISGVSLNLEKSQKYQALKENLEAQVEKQLELAKQTLKFVKGIRQQKYSVGVSVALGPYTGRGTTSIKNYIFGK